MIQGGDHTRGDGTGGESIYGENPFEDETFQLKFNRPYMVAMSNTGRRSSNGSQFFITTAKTQWLDNQYVIFGMVVGGKKALHEIEKWGTYSGKPKGTVKIVDCGEVPLPVALKHTNLN